MSKGKSFFTNLLFAVFFAAGLMSIFYINDKRQALLLPVGLIAVYAFFTGLAVRKCTDAELAEHNIESIYFLGFLYTLLSMLTLFYRFSTSSSIAEAGSRILDVFHYIGVSVTTSIAGVLLRNMVRTAWLAAHPDTGSGLAEAVLLLKETAEGFSRNYQTVYDSLNAFLAERRDNAAEFSKSEKAYTKALDACTEAAEHFAGSIKLTENKLTESMDGINSCVRAQMEGIKTLDEVNRDFSAASSRLLKDLDRLPVMQIAESIKVLGRESSELGTVMDSILSIVEKKLERVH